MSPIRITSEERRGCVPHNGTRIGALDNWRELDLGDDLGSAGLAMEESVDEAWYDIADRFDDQQDLEWAKAMGSDMTLLEDSGLWWAVPADPGDPPMGYPHTARGLAVNTICALAFGGVDGIAKAIIPGLRWPRGKS